jgi:metallo-beta-lactamase class B
MILANIKKLGYRPHDVRMLLNTHAHYDHAGGLSMLQKATGAPLMASKPEAPLLQRGGRDDPQFGDRFLYPPVTPKFLIGDGDIFGLGGMQFVPRITPGHTKGCTTWTFRVRDGARTFDVVIVGSSSVPEGYRLAGNPKYPDAIADYEKTFRTLRSLRCDIFLGAHGNFFDLAAKIEKMKKGVPHPFVDHEGYRQYIDASQQRFEEIRRMQLRAES